MSDIQSNYSDRDEYFDDLLETKPQRLHPLLTSTQLFTQRIDYEDSSNNGIFYNGLKECIEVASEHIKLIFKQLDLQIQQKQIERKVIPFSASNALLYAEKMLYFGYQNQDGDNESQNADDLEDNEPQKVKIDQWMRATINIDLVQPIEETKSQGTKNLESDRDSNQSKQSRVSEVSQWRRYNNSGQKGQRKSVKMIPEDPAPVCLEKPQQYDEFEDRMRVLKQLESKRKQEMEMHEQQALEEIKKQQQTFKKEIKGYKFTYDFDGKILNTKGIKTEKLPPANYAVSFTLKDDNIIKGKDTATSKQIIKSVKDIESKTNLPPPNLINTDYSKYMQMHQQQVQKDMLQKNKKSITNLPSQQLTRQESQSKLDKNQLNKNMMQQPAAFEYESFIPSLGVKLIYESKIKEGQRYRHEFQDLETLDRQFRIHKENEPIHITKSDYHKLTENGNLNRNLSMQNMLTRSNSTKKNVILSPLKKDSTQTKDNILSPSKFNDFSSAFKNENRRAFSLHNSQNISIKVENPDLIQGLIDDNENTIETPPLQQIDVKKLPKLHERTKSTHTNQSPSDLFNLHILEDQGWGKGKVGTFIPFDQHIKKPTQNDLRKSLNSLYKLPRERDLLQTKKKQEQEINKQIQEQLQQKTGQVKQIEKLTKELQQGFKQSFYSTRSAFENGLRQTYGHF